MEARVPRLKVPEKTGKSRGHEGSAAAGRIDEFPIRQFRILRKIPAQIEDKVHQLTRCIEPPELLPFLIGKVMLVDVPPDVYVDFAKVIPIEILARMT